MRMTAEELRDATCIVCPAQRLRLGEFDVVEHPEARNRLDPAVGYRRDRVHGFPVCAHPYRVELPPGAYASEGVPLPDDDAASVLPMPRAADLDLPEDPADLEGWIIAVLRVAGPSRMAPALESAEATAMQRFSASQVLAAMRRVLTVEMVRR